MAAYCRVDLHRSDRHRSTDLEPASLEDSDDHTGVLRESVVSSRAALSQLAAMSLPAEATPRSRELFQDQAVEGRDAVPTAEPVW